MKAAVENKKNTFLHRFTPSPPNDAPHRSTDTRRVHRNNTFCRFVNIKNRDLTHLAHHTKQYQTRNTMCHYKGINDLLNQVFVSSVQQKRYTVLCGVPDLWDTTQPSTFQHCHMLGWKGRKYHISTTNPRYLITFHMSPCFQYICLISGNLVGEEFP